MQPDCLIIHHASIPAGLYKKEDCDENIKTLDGRVGVPGQPDHQ
jgi:hypothetical protein